HLGEPCAGAAGDVDERGAGELDERVVGAAVEGARGGGDVEFVLDPERGCAVEADVAGAPGGVDGRADVGAAVDAELAGGALDERAVDRRGLRAGERTGLRGQCRDGAVAGAAERAAGQVDLWE